MSKSSCKISENCDHTTNNSSINLRFLCPADVPQVKQLCRDWFPIEYPDIWYEDIASNSKFFALAAVVEEEIVGIIVTEIKLQTRCNREDQGLLGYQFSSKTSVAYILTLGVVKNYRRKGIATLLLDSLVKHLTTNAATRECKAVYLHVLTTNKIAIDFYERCKFQKFLYLPLYYSINGAAKDGYSYVLYINGGQAPWAVFSHFVEAATDVYSLFVSTISTMSSVISDSACALFQALIPENPLRFLKNCFSSLSDGAARAMFRSSSSQKYQHLANA